MATQRLTDNAIPVTRRIDPMVLWFFAIAYGIAWSIWLVEVALADQPRRHRVREPHRRRPRRIGGDRSARVVLYLMTRIQDFSFTIAGLVMVSVTSGLAGWRELGRRLTRLQIAPRWYAPGLLRSCSLEAQRSSPRRAKTDPP